MFAVGGPANFENIPARSATIGSGVKFNASAKSVHYILVEHGDNVITGVEGIAGKGVSVHPNPARETFRIDVPVPGFFLIEMTDPPES